MKRKMLSVAQEIHYRAKLEALKRGVSLKDLTDQAITEYLDKIAPTPKEKPQP